MNMLVPLVAWNVGWSAVLALVLYALGRWPILQRRPALMHLLWFGVLLRLVVPAVITLPLVPHSPLKVRFEADFSQPLSKTIAIDFVPVVQSTSPEVAQDQVPLPGVSSSWNLPAALLVIWLAGTFGLSLFSTFRHFRFNKLILLSQPAPQELIDLCGTLADSLKLSINPQVRLIVGLSTPAVLPGFRTPTIFLPQHLLSELPESAWASILTHELAHLKRRDHVFNLIGVSVLYLFWWNPVAWWAWREMRISQEASCDAIALSGNLVTRRAYAETLLCVIDSWRQSPATVQHVTLGFGQQTSLTRRFEMIANPTVRTSSSRFSVACIVALGLTFFCMPVRAEKKVETTSAAAKEKKELVLKYDDGTADGKRSIAGTGEMIEFEVPEDGYMLKAVKLHCARYGTPKAPKEDAEFTIVSEDESSVLHTELVPYANFKRGDSRWTTITFKKPVTVPKKFWLIVDFNAEQTKGVYLSFDSSTGGKHSKTGVAGGDSEPVKVGGDWMIQAVVAKEQ